MLPNSEGNIAIDVKLIPIPAESNCFITGKSALPWETRSVPAATPGKRLRCGQAFDPVVDQFAGNLGRDRKVDGKHPGLIVPKDMSQIAVVRQPARRRRPGKVFAGAGEKREKSRTHGLLQTLVTFDLDVPGP